MLGDEVAAATAARGWAVVGAARGEKVTVEVWAGARHFKEARPLDAPASQRTVGRHAALADDTLVALYDPFRLLHFP